MNSDSGKTVAVPALTRRVLRDGEPIIQDHSSLYPSRLSDYENTFQRVV